MGMYIYERLIVSMVLLFQEFEKHLPLSSKGQIKSKEEGGLDETAERKGSTELKLYV